MRVESGGRRGSGREAEAKVEGGGSGGMYADGGMYAVGGPMYAVGGA